MSAAAPAPELAPAPPSLSTSADINYPKTVGDARVLGGSPAGKALPLVSSLEGVDELPIRSIPEPSPLSVGAAVMPRALACRALSSAGTFRQDTDNGGVPSATPPAGGLSADASARDAMAPRGTDDPHNDDPPLSPNTSNNIDDSLTGRSTRGAFSTVWSDGDSGVEGINGNREPRPKIVDRVKRCGDTYSRGNISDHDCGDENSSSRSTVDGGREESGEEEVWEGEEEEEQEEETLGDVVKQNSDDEEDVGRYGIKKKKTKTLSSHLTVGGVISTPVGASNNEREYALSTRLLDSFCRRSSSLSSSADAESEIIMTERGDMFLGGSKKSDGTMTGGGAAAATTMSAGSDWGFGDNEADRNGNGGGDDYDGQAVTTPTITMTSKNQKDVGTSLADLEV